MYSGLLYGKEAREGLAKGVEKLVDAVKVTLGGNGKNVIILDSLSHPHITKDGVTVAKSFNLIKNVEQGGVEIVRQAAIESASITGDGTTTATVLAGALINKGIKEFDNVNINDFREGMLIAERAIDEYLTADSKDISDDVKKLIAVATLSANGNKEIGELIGKSVHKSGFGVELVVEKDPLNRSGISFEMKKGYTYKKGINPFFETIPGSSICTYENARVMILDCHLGSLGQISHILESYSISKTPLVIMTKTCDPKVTQDLAVHQKKGNINVVQVELPDFGDIQDLAVQDLAVCTKSKVFKTLSGEYIEDIDLGFIDKFEGNSVNSTLVFLDEEEIKDIINDRLKYIKESFTKLREDQVVIAKERFKRLSDGVGIIKIGSITDTEYITQKDLVDDAIGSVKSAMECGYVKGGGVALIKASMNMIKPQLKNKSEEIGFYTVIEACKEPFIQMLKNCSVDNYEEILQKIVDSNYVLGYDSKNKELRNLEAEGIIDAKKVTITSLKSAISSTIGILTTDCIIYPVYLTDK